MAVVLARTHDCHSGDPQKATSFMQFRFKHTIWLVFVALIGTSISGSAVARLDNGSHLTDSRYSPLVAAVADCRMSVVNLRGRKTVPVDPSKSSSTQKLKQVNGMGTGVVIDSRGYVLTNYHVVQGVKTIEVTTADHQQTTAELLAHDTDTDLAILKINTENPLPTIKIGTSSDLMLAESVTAVGNAYGYEHTVTLGIISALNRTVQVNDDQIYRNLIQTDAAINPGNSGGPLLNVKGEMIGINVAVRIGAQGIAFAIPVNDAIDIAAELMSELVPPDVFHGLSTRTVYRNDKPHLVVASVLPKSPAAKAGLVIGDRIVSIDEQDASHELDFQTAMVQAVATKKLRLGVIHNNQPSDVTIVLQKNTSPMPTSIAWRPLGLKLASVSEKEMASRHPNYKRGLRVTAVRPHSPAEEEGIMPGDILVAMHGWKTESFENLAYILQRPDVVERKDFMFHILRDKEPFWGQMRVAQLPTR